MNRPCTRSRHWRLTRCWLLVMALTSAAAARAATFTLVVLDGPGEGFNDNTPVSPVPGNSGTTLGQQRRNAFAAAFAYFANRLGSGVDIRVEASFDPLSCSPTSGLLGQAGALLVFRDFASAPLPGTWYAVALANALRGVDGDATKNDIMAKFNSALGTPGCLTGLDWSYVVGVPAPAGTRRFYDTAIHELAHGLGFASFVNATTGEKFLGMNDAFMTLLEDHSTATKWPAMNNAQRAASAIDTGDLHWTGPAAITAGAGLAAGRHPSGHLRMYSPNPLEPGSSVSHWDKGFTPDEFMEPLANVNESDITTTALFKDIGWSLLQAPSGPCVADGDTGCLLGNRFRVEFVWRSAAGQPFIPVNRSVLGTDGASLWYFSNPNNLEALIKMVPGCPLNNRFWVFVAATTNVGYEITVTDTQTSQSKKYPNPVGNLASPVGDTSAFATCP